MKLSRLEMETSINFNEQEGTAEVYTYNGKMKKRLAELLQSRPDEVELVGTDDTGAATYNIPKRWIKINPPRILSDETKEIYRQGLIASKMS